MLVGKVARKFQMLESRTWTRRGFAIALFATLIISLAARGHAEEIRPGFSERVFQDARGTHKYIIFVPAAYTPEVNWPVILYLHGASARGTDNRMQIVGGLGTQVNARRDTFPFVVVFPQCEERDSRIFAGWEADSADGARALAILDTVERELSINRSREYLLGWSMGGYGAWNLAAAYPDRWAAVVVASGAVDLNQASRLKNSRVWAFHGAADYVARIERAREMVSDVNRAGGRVVLTELPGAGHNIGHIVFSEDALYRWLLDPRQPPEPASFIRNATRNPTLAEMGRDYVFPFVPAVEVSDALYVHIDQSVLESIGFAAPGMVPESALAGSVPNVYETSRSGIAQFNVELAGLTYRGELEQVRVKTDNDGWATLQLGLRNVTFQIAQTSVTGVFTGATAGPMEIVVGSRAPVWITARVRPSVENRHLRLELGGTEVRIGDDDFYVTTPSVVGRGLPFLRDRVAEEVGRKLVSNAYGRRGEIENRLKGALPQLVTQLESKIEEALSTPKVVGSKLPGPAYYPRCVLWPERVKVDETGMALTLGVALSRPGLNPPRVPVKRIAGTGFDFDRLAKVSGLQVAIATALCDAATEVCTNSAMSTAEIHELGARGLFALGEQSTATELIPDLARYGDNLRVRTHLELAGPISLRQAGEGFATREKLMRINMQNLRIVVEIKTAPDQAAWQRCVEFDVKMDYLMHLAVSRPTFERRVLLTDMVSRPNVVVAARFAKGYEALDQTIRSQAFARIFAAGWRDDDPTSFLHGFCRESVVNDLEVGSTHIRLAGVNWRDPYIVLDYRLPRTRISNTSAQPLQYQIRGPLTAWGGPYVLPAGKSHDFPVPYAMTLRQSAADSASTLPVPMGSQFLLGPANSAEASLGTSRQ
jgi:poly(3-hydroxybutyrate) depolymerase